MSLECHGLSNHEGRFATLTKHTKLYKGFLSVAFVRAAQAAFVVDDTYD
jgi:hypothetical protein